MSKQSDPTYRILYYLVDQVQPKAIETIKLQDDYAANDYVSKLNSRRTDNLGVYRWQRVSFLEKHTRGAY